MAGKEILIVDDAVLERQTLSRILQLEGYQVEAVESGEAALAALQRRTFDLMILDLNMPGMYGMEVLSLALEAYPGLRVIVLTAYGTMETVIEALRRRVHDYIMKPARPEEIVASVERALQAEQPAEAMLAESRAEYHAGELEPQVFRTAQGVIIDTRKQTLSWNSQTIRLTPTEARFLAVLFRQYDQVVSYEEIVLSVHGYKTGGGEAAAILRPLVSRLRQKLAAVPGGDSLMKTVRGTGYLVSE